MLTPNTHGMFVPIKVGKLHRIETIYKHKQNGSLGSRLKFSGRRFKMKVKDMKSIIQDLDDDVEIEVNSILDERQDDFVDLCSS